MSALPRESPVKDMEWPPSNCFPLDILVDKSSGEKFKCGKCDELCRLAMTMECDEHEDDQVAQSKLYGKECLLTHLKTHGNKCPIGAHPNASPAKIKFVRSIILQLIAICPRKALALKNPSFRLSPLLPSPYPPTYIDFLRGGRRANILRYPPTLHKNTKSS